jgi:hypothetical protein
VDTEQRGAFSGLFWTLESDHIDRNGHIKAWFHHETGLTTLLSGAERDGFPVTGRVTALPQRLPPTTLIHTARSLP